MKRYIRASITQEVQDIVNNKKDVRTIPQQTFSYRNEDDARREALGLNAKDFEIIKYEPNDPDYWDKDNRGGLNPNYQEPYYVGKWDIYENYNATKNEELNALLKRVRTIDELNELYWAIWNIGDGTWFYTKRGNNPLNGTFDPVHSDPESVYYIVDRHSQTLKCKIANLYRVLVIK